MSKSSSDNSARDQWLKSLAQYSHSDLLAMAISLDIPVAKHDDKNTLIRALMRSMGFIIRTEQIPRPQPTKREYSEQEIYALVKQLVQDEVVLMRTIATILEDCTGIYPTPQLLLQHVCKELSYLRAHSAFSRLSEFNHAINPTHFDRLSKAENNV